MTEPVSPLEAAKAAARALDEEALTALRNWITLERLQELRMQPAIEASKAEVIAQLRDEGVVEAPKSVTVEAATATPGEVPAWVDPVGQIAHGYAPQSVVEHDGRVWLSTFPGINTYTPGGEGTWAAWQDITSQVRPAPVDEETGQPIPEPYTDSRQYTTGDLVTFDGHTYRATGDHYAAPGWTPINAHGYWHKED